MIDGNSGDDPHPRQPSTLDDMPTIICLTSVAEKEKTNPIMISTSTSRRNNEITTTETPTMI
jgi:hypothetical protein